MHNSRTLVGVPASSGVGRRGEGLLIPEDAPCVFPGSFPEPCPQWEAFSWLAQGLANHGPWARGHQQRGLGCAQLLAPRAGPHLRVGDAGICQVLSSAGSKGLPCLGGGESDRSSLPLGFSLS